MLFNFNLSKVNLWILFFATSFFYAESSFSKEILTNAALVKEAPKWLTQGRINRIADRIQFKMEWSIHRVQVLFVTDPVKYQSMHHLGPWPIAVSKKDENTILLGPQVSEKNFDRVFGHELVHMVAFQKYKEAIPKWLEEGFANYFAGEGPANYKWARTQPLPDDVKNLVHLLKGTQSEVRLHYTLSLALVQMLAEKCDLKNLVRLSVGQRMEPYIETFCNIKDLNETFKKWLSKK